MSIFICWSGERSHKLADEVKDLLRRVFPKLPEGEIFVSDNIEKGVNWFQSVVTALEKSRAGIVCLTAENLDSPWVHFEAGALASGLAGLTCVDGRADSQRDGQQQQLFTLLHGVTGAEVKGPLGAYQATATTRLEMEQMVQALARLLGPEHNESISGRHSLISAEDWKDFEKAIEGISVPLRELIPDLERLFQRKTFHEPLYRCSDLAWLRRYDGARATQEALAAHLRRVKAACKPHERALFELLLSELDGYAMTIQSLLLTPKRFDLDDSGELKIDAGIRTCCEDRRLAIRSLSGRLLRPLEDPRREEAVRFMAAETNEERKMIVHRIEGMVRKERELAFEKASDKSAIRKLCGRENPPEFRSSSWDLDRIYFYLLVQYFGVATLRWSADDASATGDHDELMEHDWLCAARDVEMEVERYRAKSKGRSLMPLIYALCAMVELHPERQDLPRVKDAVRSAITVVETELSGEVLESEVGRPIKLLLNGLKTPNTGGPSLGPGVPDALAGTSVLDH